MDTLDRIYQETLQLDKIQSERYEQTLKSFLDVFIQQMKETSLFNEFFKEVYFGGSFFDGLKLASTSQEFDLNLVFELKSFIEVEGLNTEGSKPNFAYLKFFEPTRSERKLSFDNGKGNIFLSPAKLFDLVQSAADRSISHLWPWQERLQSEKTLCWRSLHPPSAMWGRQLWVWDWSCSFCVPGNKKTTKGSSR